LATDLQDLQDVWLAKVPESVMSNLPDFSYQRCLNNLAASSWLVDTFHRNLDVDTWQSSDKAQGKPLGTGSSKKWVKGQGRLELRILPTKS
jgi:hypothetical protein